MNYRFPTIEGNYFLRRLFAKRDRNQQNIKNARENIVSQSNNIVASVRISLAPQYITTEREKKTCARKA